MDALIDLVYARMAPDYGNPTHPEDIADLRETIADVLTHAAAFKPCIHLSPEHPSS